MIAARCFGPNCELEVEYICQCTNPETYWCKSHFLEHPKSSDKAHIFEFMHSKLNEETKEEALKFLAKENAELYEIKNKIIKYFHQEVSGLETKFTDSMMKLESHLDTIRNCHEKINRAQRISKLEQDPIVKLLILHPHEAIEQIKAIIPRSSDKSYGLFSRSQEIQKMIDYFRKNKLGTLVDKLFEIERTLEEYDKIANSYKNELSQIQFSISNVIVEIDKSIRLFEDSMQKIELNRKKEVLSQQPIKEDWSISFNGPINDDGRLLSPQNLRDKKSQILSQPNSPEAEQEFRRTLMPYWQKLSDICIHDPWLDKAYQDYIKAYQKNSSLYLVLEKEGRTNLLIYDTESESEKYIVLKSPLDFATSIAHLPNGELFCFGRNNQWFGVSLIIDENLKIRSFPSGPCCSWPSSIYYKGSVFCFGGWNAQPLEQSLQFDLEEKRLYKLKNMPKPDKSCHCIVFYGDILISGYYNQNLLSYSIDKYCFTVIPFEFSANKKKVLVYVDWLYLIECAGLIYESENGDAYAWKQIGNSIIIDSPDQIYSAYNRGAMYIGAVFSRSEHCYYKFDLKKKNITELRFNANY